MDISENMIIAIVIIVLAIVTIVIFYYVVYKPKKSAGFKKYHLRKMSNPRFDTHDDLSVYSIGNKFLSISDKQGVEINIPRYNEYYELCIYEYPDMNLVRNVPYPSHIQLACPDGIAEGKYMFVLRCKGQGFELENCCEIKNMCESNITQDRNCVNISDVESYYALGLYYQSVIADRQDALIKDYISVSREVVPRSLYIHCEGIELDIEYNQTAIIVIPNRPKSMNCQDTIFINNKIVEGNKEDGFNSFEIVGSDMTHFKVEQYIYGNNAERLPFYVYIFS